MIKQDEKQTVHVVEDDTVVRKSVCATFESVGMAVRGYGTGQEFIDAYRDEPGCLVLDLRLPDISGLQVIDKLKDRYNHFPPTIIITGHGDVSTAGQATRTGVLDFIEKPFHSQQLLAQAQRALELDRTERQERQHRADLIAAVSTLSVREKEVLDRLLAGQSNKKIAIELNLSDKTVASHRANLLQKLGAESLVDLIRRLNPQAWGRVKEVIDQGAGLS